MKRFLILLATIVMFVIPAFSESANYSTMETSDLIAIQKAIGEELEKRGISDSSDIFPGEYIVGVQIKSGNYVLTCDSDYMSIELYDESDSVSSKMIVEESLYLENSLFLSLLEGQKLVLGNGSGTIRTADQDWAP